MAVQHTLSLKPLIFSFIWSLLKVLEQKGQYCCFSYTLNTFEFEVRR